MSIRSTDQALLSQDHLRLDRILSDELIHMNWLGLPDTTETQLGIGELKHIDLPVAPVNGLRLDTLL